MQLRSRGARRLLRQADGAGRDRAAHRRGAIDPPPGVDGVGPRHPRCDRDLVRAGDRARDPDHRLLRGSGVDLGHYVREIDARPYIYAGHICRTTPRPRSSAPARAGSSAVRSWALEHQVAPLHRVEDGINAVRVFLPKCWIDEKKCARGIDALKLYRAGRREARRRCGPGRFMTGPRMRPDSFRYLALTLDRKATQSGFYRRIEYSQLGVV